METDHNSIHRWLARVPDASSACNVTGDPNQLDLALADNLPNAPKIIDITHHEHPQLKGASLMQGQIQPQRASHEVHPSFDRKPRHKTREDRYEYKGVGTSKPQSTSRKGKNKGRRSRKHTMNNVFRAPNVARERLTLRGNLNVGIFNKGKASSPLKLGNGSDSAFSERRFLNKRHPGSPPKSLATDKKRKVGHKSSRKGSSRQQRRPEYLFPELAKELELENTEQLIPQAKEVNQPKFKPKVDQGHCVGRSPGLDFQREQPDSWSRHSSLILPVEKIARWSQSATPYTWSETNLGKSQLEHALEIELMNLLRVGLCPAQGDDPSRESNQNHTYYDLDELKDILDSRKGHWASETSQIVDTLSSTGFHQDSITEVHKNHERLRSGDPIDSTHLQTDHLNTEESSPEKIVSRQIPSRQVSQLDKKTVSSISQPERLEQGSFNIEDNLEAQESPPDDVFFSNLDAAFWAIVDPRTQNEMDSWVMMGIRKSSPIFDFEDIMTTAELNSAEIPKRPSQGALSHAQVEVETLYPLPPAAHDRFDLKCHATHLEKDHGNIMLPRAHQTGVSNGMMVQREPHPHLGITQFSNDDAIPPGFWRHNRLY